jgi:hypothetical protein
MIEAHIHCNTCGREIPIVDGVKPVHTCLSLPVNTSIPTIDQYNMQITMKQG